MFARVIYLNCASILTFLEEHACLNYTVPYNVVYYPRTDIKCQVLRVQYEQKVSFQHVQIKSFKVH